MRRLSRLDRSIGRLRPRSRTSPSSLLCSTCLRRAPFSTAIRRFAEPGKVSTTERLRRKIWGTDEPPGLEDPYGGPSIVEERQAARAADQSPRKKEEIVPKSQSKTVNTPVSILDPSYEPAKTWDGLEEVGELPAPEFYFEAFMPAETVTDQYEVTAALHRAVVEVFTLKQAGRPLSELSDTGIEVDHTSAVQISVPTSNPSSPLLEFPDGLSDQAILESLGEKGKIMDGGEPLNVPGAEESTEAVSERENTEDAPVIKSNIMDPLSGDESPETTEVLPPKNHQEQVASWNPSWLRVSIEDADIKFAVMKRVMQLTGNRIPDAALNSAHTVRSLLTHVTQKPKAAKLFDALAERKDLVALPNVKLFHRRISPIDKEKTVGRWKVIEKELTRRGLPLTGHS